MGRDISKVSKGIIGMLDTARHNIENNRKHISRANSVKKKNEEIIGMVNQFVVDGDITPEEIELDENIMDALNKYSIAESILLK